MRTRDTLKDITLCTIVWNAEKNPAGGIERFCHSHLPYVGHAVIYDTGSTDRTQEILTDLQVEYHNLEVITTDTFHGFSDARNTALSHVKTDKALLLDDDELMTDEDFYDLAGHLTKHHENETRPLGYSFQWISHYADETQSLLKENMFPKLIFLGHFAKPVFKKDVFEELYFGEKYWREIPEDRLVKIDVKIKHFLPSWDALVQKHSE
jgi:glycosyltransferase involved in cell wall biosynthesis